MALSLRAQSDAYDQDLAVSDDITNDDRAASFIRAAGGIDRAAEQNRLNQAAQYEHVFQLAYGETELTDNPRVNEQVRADANTLIDGAVDTFDMLFTEEDNTSTDAPSPGS